MAQPVQFTAPPGTGVQLTPFQIAALVWGAGIQEETPMRTAVALALATSGGRTGFTRRGTGGSVRRGLWGIDSKRHPSISAATAYGAQTSASAMATISHHGTNFSEWPEYTSQRWRLHLGEADLATQQVLGGMSGSGVPGGIVGTIGGTIAQGGAGVSNVAGSVTKPLMAVGEFLGKLSDAHTWVRVVLVLGGGTAMLFGIILLSRDLVGSAVKAVT